MEEFELKFLDVDVADLENRLRESGAEFKGEEFFEEWLYARPDWDAFRGRVRLRVSGKKSKIAYKETTKASGDGNLEIEFDVSDTRVVKQFLDKIIGDISPRHQQKRRRSYFLSVHSVTVDIDFWPKIPPYVEIEGSDRNSIETVAKSLGFDLSNAVEKDALQIYEEFYNISIKDVKELVF